MTTTNHTPLNTAVLGAGVIGVSWISVISVFLAEVQIIQLFGQRVQFFISTQHFAMPWQRK